MPIERPIAATGQPQVRRPGKLRLGLLALVLSGSIAACTGRPPDLVGIDNPVVPAASVATATHHKIFIATTREASEVIGAFYSGKRAPSLGLASVKVSVPPNHVDGNLERPEDLPPDPETEFAVLDPTVYRNDTGFLAALNRELATRPAGKRDVLFFVHGYNNTTSDAILRLAQFVEDTGFEGVPLLFTWASAAEPIKYVYDLNSALVARPKLSEISRILARSNAAGYDIFAHSMGGFLTMEGIVQADLAGSFNSGGRLKTVMLASPDIDIDLFRTQMAQIDGTLDGKLFILTSGDDRALRVSRRLSGGVERVGAADAEELATLGATVIDLSEVEDSTSGSHSKFAGSPEVVQLIGRGLNAQPGFDQQRQTLLGDLLGDVPIRIVLD